MSIPASEIVQVNPGVIGAGGNALALNGLMVTDNLAVAWGEVKEFATAAAVATFFGDTSTEAALALVYFNGYNNKTKTPEKLFFTRHTAPATAAWLRGGSVASMTLAALKLLTGDLTLTVDGDEFTSDPIDLSTATSFSNAATLIEAQFTAPNFSVTYDAQRTAFLFTSDTTGASSTITACTGTLAAGLKLTVATGAVLSQGVAASGAFSATMAKVLESTMNFGLLMTVYEPIKSVKVEISDWVNAQNNRFGYAMWETSTLPAEGADTTLAYADILAAGNSGTIAIYKDSEHAAFVLGTAASLDFTRTNGRTNFAFRYQSGLIASATTITEKTNLDTNGYNYISEFATANDGFTFMQKGTISGPYGSITKFLNQIRLNSQFQLAFMDYLSQIPSSGYDAAGKAQRSQVAMGPIDEALNFGTIRVGIPLSSSQAAQVNAAAGVDIATTLQNRGWYFQEKPATAQVRAAGGSPPMSFWYMDGGDVLQINLASIVIL